jgi:hypothetical protein
VRSSVGSELNALRDRITAIAGLAGAAPTTLITFNGFPLGTVVDTEYAPLGVVFTAATYNPPVISMNGAMPTQPILRPDGGPSTYRGDFWIQFLTGFSSSPLLQISS